VRQKPAVQQTTKEEGSSDDGGGGSDSYCENVLFKFFLHAW